MIAMAPVTLWDFIPFAFLVVLFVRILRREGASPVALGGLLGMCSGFTLLLLLAVLSGGMTAFQRPQLLFSFAKDWAICGLIVGVLIGLVIQRLSAPSPIL